MINDTSLKKDLSPQASNIVFLPFSQLNSDKAFHVYSTDDNGRLNRLNINEKEALKVLKYIDISNTESNKEYQFIGRSIQSLVSTDNLEKQRFTRKNITNAEAARRYITKSQLLGLDYLDIEIIDEFNVILKKVNCIDESKEIIIPSFITDFNRSVITYRKRYNTFGSTGVFRGVVCKSIKIEANLRDMSYLLTGITEISDGVIDFCNNSPESLAGLMYNTWVSGDIYIKNLNTENLIDTSLMFAYNKGIFDIHLPSELNNLKFSIGMFYNCIGLDRILDESGNDWVNNFKAQSLYDITSMFDKCFRLDISGLGFLMGENSSPTYLNRAFACINIPNANDINEINLAKAKECKGTFSKCSIDSSNNTLRINKWIPDKLEESSRMFEKISGIEHIIMEGIKFKSLKDISLMFSNNTDTISIDLTTIHVPSIITLESLCTNSTKLNTVKLWKDKKHAILNIDRAFDNCIRLTNVQFNGLNTSMVTSFAGIFNACANIEYIDLSSLDLHDAKDFRSMFSGCMMLKEVRFPDSKVSSYKIQLERADWMFDRCISLEYIDLSLFSEIGENQVNTLFYNCSKLKEVKIAVMCDETWGKNEYDIVLKKHKIW